MDTAIGPAAASAPTRIDRLRAGLNTRLSLKLLERDKLPQIGAMLDPPGRRLERAT